LALENLAVRQQLAVWKAAPDGWPAGTCAMGPSPSFFRPDARIGLFMAV